MWQRSHTKFYQGVTPQQIWSIWSDIDNWHQWDPDVASCKLNGPFQTGSHFMLQPLKGPKVKIELLKVEPMRGFTDLTRFPGAHMFGEHLMEIIDGGIQLTTTMSIKGPLSFLWRKLVAEGIVNTLPEQMDNLVALASHEA